MNRCGIDEKFYEVAGPGSLAERLAILARNRIYNDFLCICRPRPEETILDVGVSDVTGNLANFLERSYSFPSRITAVGIGAGHRFQEAFPTVRYRQIAANKPLPFADALFDIATSNAVLEHVGSREDQRRFVAELMRVGRRVFLTVPSRYFPIEQHTSIPLLHWTGYSFALVCRILGKQDWSRPENLILMSPRALRAACPPEARVQIGMTGIPLGPWSSNLYLSGSIWPTSEVRINVPTRSDGIGLADRHQGRRPILV
jgi:SAM-dependent methyltransferase